MIKVRKTSPILFICRTLIYVFFSLTLILFLHKYNSSLFILRMIFLISASMMGYFLSIKKGDVFLEPVFLAVLFIVNWICCILTQKSLNYEINNLVYTISYIGMAVLLLRNYCNLFLSTIVMGWSMGIIGFKMMLGIPNSEILLANSRNYISVLLLFTVLLYYLTCYQQKKELNIIPAIINFVICILAYGRGGILASAFLLAGLCFCKIIYVKGDREKIMLILLLLAVAVIFFKYLIDTNKIYLMFNKFYKDGTVDSVRLEIWKSFLKNNFLTPETVLWGSGAKEVWEDGNLHNSFLQLYASFGLIPFVTISGLIIQAFIHGLREDALVWNVLFVTLLIRALTDKLFFQGYCEVFLYYFVMYWRYHGRKKHGGNCDEF